jgi:flagellar biosynthesis/type III secretory pathway chaperone
MSAAQDEVFLSLRGHLDAELALHRGLLGLAEAKQQKIVAGDMPAFTALLQREQGPLAEMNRLRQQRERLLKGVAERLNLCPADLHLSQLVERSPESLRPELRARQGELQSILGRLREVNERNLALIRQGLGLVRDLMQTLVGGAHTGAYDRLGSQGGVAATQGRLVNFTG